MTSATCDVYDRLGWFQGGTHIDLLSRLLTLFPYVSSYLDNLYFIFLTLFFFLSIFFHFALFTCNFFPPRFCGVVFSRSQIPSAFFSFMILFFFHSLFAFCVILRTPLGEFPCELFSDDGCQVRGFMYALETFALATYTCTEPMRFTRFPSTCIVPSVARRPSDGGRISFVGTINTGYKCSDFEHPKNEERTDVCSITVCIRE